MHALAVLVNCDLYPFCSAATLEPEDREEAGADALTLGNHHHHHTKILQLHWNARIEDKLLLTSSVRTN